jgi:hypothetical protein
MITTLSITRLITLGQDPPYLDVRRIDGSNFLSGTQPPETYPPRGEFQTASFALCLNATYPVSEAVEVWRKGDIVRTREPIHYSEESSKCAGIK